MSLTKDQIDILERTARLHDHNLRGLNLTGYDIGTDADGKVTSVLLHFGEKKLHIEAGNGYLRVNGGYIWTSEEAIQK